MWHKVYVKTTVLVLALIAQILLMPFQVFAQSSGFSVTPVVKRGDPVSDGGRFFDCDGCEGRVIGLHALNNLGDVAIGGDISGSCFEGRFIISTGESIRLADFCQQTPFGKFGILGSVNLNDNGEAAMLAGVTVENRIDAALFLYSDGQLTKIVEEGDISPIGTIFKGCGFGQPAINNNGEVAFHACAETREGFFNDGVFIHSGGEMRKVVVSGDPSPIGGEFVINFIPAQPVQINDNGDVLFRASVLLDIMTQKFGLFLATDEGIKKIEVDGEQMPAGGIVTPKTMGIGDLNDKGEVAFAVGLTGSQSDLGIFLYSEGQTSKVMVAGDPTPAGGTFSSPSVGSFIPPRINDNGAVAFSMGINDGSASSAIFLASTKAIVKVAAVGDKLPTGGKIREITSFALNDFGQVAFYADVKNGPQGVFLATPLPPEITKIKLKRKKGTLELRVNGKAMITNDTVIEVDGIALEQTNYPTEFRENGGTTTRVVSRDARLEQLLQSGQAVQVTVFNSLTNLRSAPAAFTR